MTIRQQAEAFFGKGVNETLTKQDPVGLRFGTHGSVRVWTKGEDRGKWWDFENEVGGHLDYEQPEVVPTVRLIVDKYDYVDEAGNFVMQVVRYQPKDFRQRRPNANGGWIWSVRDQEIFPYRLQEMIGVDDVVIVEGEKDVDTLAKLGVVATTKPGGTGKWPAGVRKYFAGKNLFVIPDNDSAGKTTAKNTCQTFADVAASVRYCDICSHLPLKSDVSDYVTEQTTREKLWELLHEYPVLDNVVNEIGKDVFHTENVGDLSPVTDADDFVENLLIAGQMSVLYGPSNSGKTFLATDIAAHVSLGRSWRGKEVTAGGVVYIAAEGAYGIRNRMVAFREHYQVDENFPFAILPSPVNFFDAEEDMARLQNTLRAKGQEFGCGISLVVVDTLARVAAGADENTSADMGQIIQNVDTLCQSTGAHVMLVHHSGKDVAKGARGSSSLRAATATEIEVEPLEGYSVARVTKQRDLEVTGEFGFSLQVVELGVNPRGGVVSSCVVVEHVPDIISKRPSKPRGAAQNLCYGCLEKVIREQGKMHYFDGSQVKGVSLEVWREMCFLSLTGEQKHKWTSFRRAVDSLVGYEFVGKRDEIVWIK